MDVDYWLVVHGILKIDNGQWIMGNWIKFMNLKDRYFYIEFEITNLKRFEYFQIMFEKLRKIKNDWMQYPGCKNKKINLDYRDPVEALDWHRYLDDDAIAYFEDTFDYESEEGKVYWEIWNLTHYKYRDSSFFMTPGNWDLESMLDSIFNGEYPLINIIKEADNQGCLYYDPLSHPFGGSDSLVELTRAFGNRVTYDSWHEDENPKIESQWNYELAKELVEKGIGFTPEMLQNL